MIHTELTHLTAHTWKEVTDISCQISPLNVLYRKNGLFAVPVYQALYQRECRLQGGPHVYEGVLRGMR